MEKIKKFLANKSVGYYVAAAIALITLALSIVFFTTSKGTFPNSAASYVTDSVGIYLLVGAIIEIVFLVIPQYRFIHIIATFIYSLSFGIEALIFAPLVAGKANNVEYEGGNFEYHLFFTIAIVVLFIVCIAAAFIGFFKSEEGLDEEMKLSPKNPLKIALVAVSAVIIVGSITTGTVIENVIRSGLSKTEVQEEQFDQEETVNHAENKNITQEIKDKVTELAYDFNPKDVIIKQQSEYNYNDSTFKALKSTSKRENVHMVYYFEGTYAEGYQGDYSPTYGSIKLWEDGIYTGKIKDTEIKGYWFNSSTTKTGTDADGNDKKDKLVLVSNIDRYESMICSKKGGFYDVSLYAYLNMGWGQRSMELTGYYYYPDVATFINYAGTNETFKVGEKCAKGQFTTQHVLANFKYNGVFVGSEIKWTWPSGMLDKNDTFIAAGEYELKSVWNGFTATRKIVVTE